MSGNRNTRDVNPGHDYEKWFCLLRHSILYILFNLCVVSVSTSSLFFVYQMLNSSGVLNTFKYSLIGSIIFKVIGFNTNKMNNTDIVLILLTTIELLNLVVRMIKIMPPREPAIDKNILRTMYC